MKLFGLIAIALLSFSACQKENLRPDCPSDRTSETTENNTAPQASSLASRPEGETTGGNPENAGGGIVDPNADQDSNTTLKNPKKR